AARDTQALQLPEAGRPRQQPTPFVLKSVQAEVQLGQPRQVPRVEQGPQTSRADLVAVQVQAAEPAEPGTVGERREGLGPPAAAVGQPQLSQPRQVRAFQYCTDSPYAEVKVLQAEGRSAGTGTGRTSGRQALPR